MDKCVILAVAGAGKTYHICHDIDECKRNIILAFTNQNVLNIRRELEKRFNRIPENTIVTTFHSFRYNFMIRPFDCFIGKCYGDLNFRSSGVSILAPPQLRVNGRYNPYYSKDNTLAHYCINHKYYADRLSKLILKTKEVKTSLLDLGCQNIARFFDSVYIDESQDYREEDWKLLEQIIKRTHQITLVGDFYQHSVSGTNNHGIPFQRNKEYIDYESYKSMLQSLGLNVDMRTLIKSRRCSKEVCHFISQKLGITIESQGVTNGNVIFLEEENEIRKALNDDGIVKLVWNSPEKYSFHARTWGYSKGDTYDAVCILLTKPFEKLSTDNFKLPASISSINKLYVALTRSSGDVYIVAPEHYENIV